MPILSKKRKSCSENIKTRWNTVEKIKIHFGSDNHGFDTNINVCSEESQLENRSVSEESSHEIPSTNDNSKSTQTDFIKSKTISCQTVQDKSYYSSSIDNFDFDNVSTLIDLFIDTLGEWSTLNNRILSIIVYLIIRLCGIKFQSTREILEKLNLMSINHCQSWLNSAFEEDDMTVVLKDERGNYKRIDFYETYPELEKEAKLFALEHATQKKCTFTVNELAKFINKRFFELYGDSFKEDFGELIRSEESCRTDLLRWGARWDSNTKRPYFEGHEREDVLVQRRNFIDFLVLNKNLYYIPDYDATNILKYNKPSGEGLPRILISHDESTFRSGELPQKRWLFPELAPFYKKGRGSSLMLSFFIIMHETMKVFELSEDEWALATKYLSFYYI